MKRKTKAKIKSKIFVALCVCVVIAGAYFRIIQKPLPELEANTEATTSCGHVKRIKPSNLVQYNTREEAVSSGRRGCKVCK